MAPAPLGELDAQGFILALHELKGSLKAQVSHGDLGEPQALDRRAGDEVKQHRAGHHKRRTQAMPL